MTANLKPCPNQLCNSTTVRVITLDESDPDLYDGYEEYYVKCFDCFVATRWFRDKTKAIQAWNHRPFEDYAVEVVQKLVRSMKIYEYYFGYIRPDAPIENEVDFNARLEAEAKQLLGVS
jgi:hypothetical protein